MNDKRYEDEKVRVERENIIRLIKCLNLMLYT